MADENTTASTAPTSTTRPRRRAASRPAGPPVTPAPEAPVAEAPAIETAVAAEVGEPAPVKKAARKAPARKTTRSAPKAAAAAEAVAPAPAADTASEPASESASESAVEPGSEPATEAVAAPRTRSRKAAATAVMFQAPDAAAAKKVARKPKAKAAVAPVEPDEELLELDADGNPIVLVDLDAEPAAAVTDDEAGEETTAEGEEPGEGRRRRRRGGRRRNRGRERTEGAEGDEATDADAEGEEDVEGEGEAGDDEAGRDGSHRRRRRRRRSGQSDDNATDDPPNTVVRVRDSRGKADELAGSTRLQAKKNRRREGREAGRRRTSILTEAEFLARREDVDRTMLVRQSGDRVQIAVLEDDILVEHYVNRTSGQSLIGNVYLGRVQNVLPSMEAAFIDIGRGRNAVLYAGEVNWDAAGLEGQPKRIEFALKSGDPVLVQVTKDPVGQKGARLTSQISLPGRYLVYVPDGSMTGISRKLPDTERARLKRVLRSVLPESAGVIVRTAAEGASEEELSRDVARLTAQWDDIEAKSKTASAPALLYGEPDLAIKVVRDIFNEDFKRLIVAGDDVYDTLSDYVRFVAPDLADRVSKWVEPKDLFAAHRVDEQLSKALDRKVYLPSGGSLVIDRTEAMTVVDVNTGKFTGEGGTLEETVTQNNLEAAEEIIRQLRLRDIGGIIVVDFIDMVLESNRDKVVRRLIECLGRDRTKHQVAEVTSLGLVQMTRKRIGQGLLETFSESCEHCNGRGVKVSLHTVHVADAPVTSVDDEDRPKAKKSRGGRGAGAKAKKA